MSKISFLAFPLLLCLTLLSYAVGQTTAQLRTSDTELVFETSAGAPRMVSLAFPGQAKWENRASESLIASAEIEGNSTPLSWKFNPGASQLNEQRVAFVYDSASPHLRLTWEWIARQTYGPVEHEIRIENLDEREIWIPMQDSLAFDWQIDPKAALRQMFVEKGANTPSAVGTHEVAITDRYHWTGTASTYGDIDEKEPREIIPWTLVDRNDAAHTGWYAGIEFSGRTRI